jgi:dephospho-CoA kinase
MQKLIIGLVGEMASGKDEAKKYLNEKYGAKSCKFSTPIRDVLNRLNIEVSRDNMVSLSISLREKFGQDLFAKVIASDARALDSDIVVVDGVRRLEDIDHLSVLPHFKLVRIEADSKLRYERMKLRNENIGDAEKTYGEFMEDHESETEATIPEVMEKAEYCLNNDGNLNEFHKQIDVLILKIK